MSPKRKPGWTPPLKKHLGGDGTYRGRVRLPGAGRDGKPLDRYCGTWPPERPESDPPPAVLAAYRRAVSEWLAGQGTVPMTAPALLTVGELLLAHRRWADSVEGYRRHGRRGSEYYCYAALYTPLLDLYELLPARDFGPVELRAVRQAFTTLVWTRKGQTGRWSRHYVNEQVHRVRRVWGWAVERGLVPLTTLDALRVVRPLKRGRGASPEAAGGKKSVPWATVEATLPWLPPVLQTLARVHWLAGCRANEACAMVAAEIDRTADPDGKCWLFTPGQHKRASAMQDPKTVHYWLGPEAQMLLTPLLEAAVGPEAPLFPSARAPARKAQAVGRYTRATYTSAVTKAIKRAAAAEPSVVIPRWSTGRIRHGRATELRAIEHAAGRHGREGAGAVLGHEDSSTTIRYAERDALARKIQAQNG